MASPKFAIVVVEQLNRRMPLDDSNTSYNILAGGKLRVDQLTKIISSTQPYIVCLVEANNLQVVEELADRLDMQYRMNANPTHKKDWQTALLSRLPIIETHSHIHADIL